MTKRNQRKRSTKMAAIDQHVAMMIRRWRLTRGLTQQDLARDVGVSFQQLQKYERGTNRVAASRLYALAGALGLTVTDFYVGVDESQAEIEGHQGTPRLSHSASQVASITSKFSPKAQSLALATVKSIQRLERAAGRLREEQQ